MKTKITLLISAWMCFAFSQASAQHLIPGASDYHELALLFSQYNYKGSSRIQGLGGAQTSLGGDLSSALSNPAGLGFYNRSEFSFTPSVNIYSTESMYQNRLTNAVRPKFNFDQFGVALHKKYKNNSSGFIGGTFAISYSKVSEFNHDFDVNGLNPRNDVIDHFTQVANHNKNIDPGNFPTLTRLAYDSYLISSFTDPDTQEEFYDRTVDEYPSQEFPVDQMDQVESSGSQNHWNFSYGANYKDVLYIGASLGLISINYNIEKFYSELYPSGSILSEMSLFEALNVNGTGVNGTFGIIARPISQLTIGASVVTPSYIALSEEGRISMNAFFDNYQFDGETLRNEGADQDFIFDYSLVTPARVNGGLTYFIGKYGFITTDIEWVNYSSMRLNGDGDPMNDQDQIIQESYSDVLNIKIGAEARLDKFRIRAGYSMHPSPYTDGNQKNINRMSLGAGYRNSNMFVDVATTLLRGKVNYSPYSFAPINDNDIVDPSDDIYVTPVSNMNYKDLNINFTVGFFFQ